MFDGATRGALDPAERRARVALARAAGVGPVTFHQALQHFGSARAACAALATPSPAAIAREESLLAKAGGRFLVVGDPEYPLALAAMAFALIFTGAGAISIDWAIGGGSGGSTRR